MYRLFEVTKTKDNQKEQPAIYPFENFTDMEASYESKIGAWMKSDVVEGELLIMLDGSLNTMSLKKIGDYVFKPRLIEVKTTAEEEEANPTPYDSKLLVEANYHSKLGSAMSNKAVLIEVLKGIDGNGADLQHRSWIRPIEAPEPTPEPEEETEPTPEPEVVEPTEPEEPTEE